MDIPSLACPACKGKHDLSDLLTDARWWRAVDAVQSTCPATRRRIEFRIEPGVLRFGYTYAASAPHFAAMEDYPCEGCQVEWGDDLTVSYGDQMWTIPQRS